MKSTKTLTDEEIRKEINALEEENRNTKRLSMGRGHGWGDTALDKRRDRIQHLQTILMLRKLEKKKTTPKSKKKTPKTLKVKAIETLAPFVTVDGKLYKLKKGDIVILPKTNADILLEHGVAVLSKGKVTAKAYTIPTSAKHKIGKEYKMTKREKWLLSGKYKILGMPKKTKSIPKGYEVKKVLGVFDIYFHNEHIGTRPTREGAVKYIEAHKDSRTGVKKLCTIKYKPFGLDVQKKLFGGF